LNDFQIVNNPKAVRQKARNVRELSLLLGGDVVESDRRSIQAFNFNQGSNLMKLSRFFHVAGAVCRDGALVQCFRRLQIVTIPAWRSEPRLKVLKDSVYPGVAHALLPSLHAVTCAGYSVNAASAWRACDAVRCP